jgi:hypothetical protein
MPDLSIEDFQSFYTPSPNGPARIAPREDEICWWCARRLQVGELLFAWVRRPGTGVPLGVQVCERCNELLSPAT